MDHKPRGYDEMTEDQRILSARFISEQKEREMDAVGARAIDIRAARAKNPKLGIGEILLLSLNLGGPYYHPFEGRMRAAMTADKGLTLFIRFWLLIVGGFWFLALLNPIGEILKQLWDLAAMVGVWVGLSLAPGLFALWWRAERRKRGAE